MDNESKLCFLRIKNNLEILLYFAPVDIMKAGIEVFRKDPKHHLLIDNYVDEDDAIEFAGKFRFTFEKSLSYRFITTVNRMIDGTKNPKEKAALTRIKFEMAFIGGNEVEEELMSHNFKTVKNNISEEMQNNFGIDPLLKRDYLNMHASERIMFDVAYLSKLEPNISATKLLIEFKSLILYLDKTNLISLEQVITCIPFKSKVIKSLLLQSISLNEENKKIHDEDSKQRSL